MDYTIAFDAPAEKIYQDFTSREYWQTLMDAYRFLTPQSEITRFRSDERGTDIVFKQNLPRMYLPPVARTVMPVDMVITREQHFDPYDHTKAGRRAATAPLSRTGPAGSAASISSPRQTETGLAASCGSRACARCTSRSSGARSKT